MCDLSTPHRLAALRSVDVREDGFGSCAGMASTHCILSIVGYAPRVFSCPPTTVVVCKGVRRGFTLTTSVVHRVSSKRERWMIRSLDELARAPEELVNRRALQTGVSCWPPRDTSDCARRRQGAWQTHQLSCYRPDRADQRKSCQTLLHSHSGDS